jgi:hypothetical protein
VDSRLPDRPKKDKAVVDLRLARVREAEEEEEEEGVKEAAEVVL